MIRNGENWGGSFKEYAVPSEVLFGVFWSKLLNPYTFREARYGKFVLGFGQVHKITLTINYCIDEKQTQTRFESLMFNLLSGVGFLDELKRKASQ